MLELGSLAPDFALLDVVSGKIVRRDDFREKKGLLVLFLCPHCPYVKHIQKSLAELGRDFQGAPLGIVAICSNSVTVSPADDPEEIKKQAEAAGFVFPYLFDERQTVAKEYRAACTPDIYLFDGDFKLVYRGQYDSSRPDNTIPVTGEDLRMAINMLLAGQSIPTEQFPSIGCSIKWKQ
jgi:peroxiredoxin